jgi:hypothetical protein
MLEQSQGVHVWPRAYKLMGFHHNEVQSHGYVLPKKSTPISIIHPRMLQSIIVLLQPDKSIGGFKYRGVMFDLAQFDRQDDFPRC